MKIFDFTAERELALQLSQDLVRQLPPSNFSSEKKADLSVNRVSRALERIYAIAVGKNKEKKMGSIRRSIFANGFKWKLKEAGYPADFIDMATEGLIVELAKRK